MKFGGLFHGFSFGAGFELMRRIIVPAILVMAPLGLWWWLGPEKPTCDTARKQAAQFAIAQVAEQIRVARGDGITRAAVLHLANDSSDYVTESLRERLSTGGLLDLDGTPVVEKIRNLLNLRNPGIGVENVEEAVKYGRRHKLGAVIVGSIERFETVKGTAEITGMVKFIKLETDDTANEIVEIPLTNKRPQPAGKEADDDPPPPVASSSWRETMSLPMRLLLVAVGIAIVPVLLFPFLKLVMRRDSNAATALVLVLLLVIDGTITGVMLGTRMEFPSLALFLVVLSAGFGYDLFMLSFAQLCRPALPGAR